MDPKQRLPSKIDASWILYSLEDESKTRLTQVFFDNVTQNLTDEGKLLIEFTKSGGSLQQLAEGLQEWLRKGSNASVAGSKPTPRLTSYDETPAVLTSSTFAPETKPRTEQSGYPRLLQRSTTFPRPQPGLQEQLQPGGNSYPAPTYLSDTIRTRQLFSRALPSGPSVTVANARLTMRYKLIFYVPKESLEAVKNAVFGAGAGTSPGGKYQRCCFESYGTEQFLPIAERGANPTIGSKDSGSDEYRLERVEEVRCEVLCVGKDTMRSAVQALKEAHPYEEPAYEVYKMEDV